MDWWSGWTLTNSCSTTWWFQHRVYQCWTWFAGYRSVLCNRAFADGHNQSLQVALSTSFCISYMQTSQPHTIALKCHHSFRISSIQSVYIVGQCVILSGWWKGRGGKELHVSFCKCFFFSPWEKQRPNVSIRLFVTKIDRIQALSHTFSVTSNPNNVSRHANSMSVDTTESSSGKSFLFSPTLLCH